MAINFSFNPHRAQRCVLTALLAMLTLGALSLPPDLADAHDIGAERQVLVQVFEDRVDVALFYTEAPGARSGLLITRFDVNGDGELEGPEADLAGRALLPRMLGGLQFELPGERPRTGQPELKVEVRQGRVAAAAMMSYALPELQAEATRTMIVRALKGDVLESELHIMPGGALMPADAASGPGALPSVLRSGEEVVASFKINADALPEPDAGDASGSEGDASGQNSHE
ncbi:hypothetical protein FRC98_05955 [Lujinxingia vulgaris]|uniref:EF-hand domain-containing protein n=1 Tax=Lujinxingia vulgaris TaxID=2600176 RepID=A0A5C6X9D4_9DELT|nr:hypothetical protein [Lujinxingia vulgaris]TXD38431.1 hypothetical protein FRC98_05955 [Lujinxingia vulgaris]